MSYDKNRQLAERWLREAESRIRSGSVSDGDRARAAASIGNGYALLAAADAGASVVGPTDAKPGVGPTEAKG